MLCLWVVSEFPQMGGEAPGAAIGCGWALRMMGLMPFLGSPAPACGQGEG